MKTCRSKGSEKKCVSAEVLECGSEEVEEVKEVK
jgi:hypothetical protein